METEVIRNLTHLKIKQQKRSETECTEKMQEVFNRHIKHIVGGY